MEWSPKYPWWQLRVTLCSLRVVTRMRHLGHLSLSESALNVVSVSVVLHNEVFEKHPLPKFPRWANPSVLQDSGRGCTQSVHVMKHFLRLPDWSSLSYSPAVSEAGLGTLRGRNWVHRRGCRGEASGPQAKAGGPPDTGPAEGPPL